MIIIRVDFHPEFQQIALLNRTNRRGRGQKRPTPAKLATLPRERELHEVIQEAKKMASQTP